MISAILSWVWNLRMEFSIEIIQMSCDSDKEWRVFSLGGVFLFNFRFVWVFSSGNCCCCQLRSEQNLSSVAEVDHCWIEHPWKPCPFCSKDTRQFGSVDCLVHASLPVCLVNSTQAYSNLLAEILIQCYSASFHENQYGN